MCRASRTSVGKRRSKKLQLVPTLGNLQARSGTAQATRPSFAKVDIRHLALRQAVWEL